MPTQTFAFRELPTTDQSGVTLNFEQLMAGLNPAWIFPVFEHEWANFDAAEHTKARFLKDLQGFVHIEGLIKAGKINESAFTLPAGFRPGAVISFAEASNGAFGELSILAKGAVIPAVGNNAFFGLNCIFRAEN